MRKLFLGVLVALFPAFAMAQLAPITVPNISLNGSPYAPLPSFLVGVLGDGVTPCWVGQAGCLVSNGGGSGPGGAITAGLGAYAAGSIATGAAVDGWNITAGAKADAACGTDNGTCGELALIKRGNQRITSLIAALGSPFQANGSIGNTGFGVTSFPTGATLVNTATAVEACHVFKASAGTLYGFTVNTDASAGATDWVLVYNATTAPVDGTTAPVDWGRVGASGTFTWSAATPQGVNFTTGITVCLSTTGPFTKTADAHAVLSGKIK